MFTKSIVNKEEFSFDLFWKVIEDNMLGRTKPKKQNENEIRTIAYHEIGHAVISKYVGDDVIKVSIGERSMSAGVSISIPKDHESMLKTEDKIYKEMMVAIAGKMAEKIFIGEVT
jgi:ATP-dependent zinc metalloprotease ftsH